MSTNSANSPVPYPHNHSTDNDSKRRHKSSSEEAKVCVYRFRRSLVGLQCNCRMFFAVCDIETRLVVVGGSRVVVHLLFLFGTKAPSPPTTPLNDCGLLLPIHLQHSNSDGLLRRWRRDQQQQQPPPPPPNDLCLRLDRGTIVVVVGSSSSSDGRQQQPAFVLLFFVPPAPPPRLLLISAAGSRGGGGGSEGGEPRQARPQHRGGRGGSVQLVRDAQQLVAKLGPRRGGQQPRCYLLVVVFSGGGDRGGLEPVNCPVCPCGGHSPAKLCGGRPTSERYESILASLGERCTFFYSFSPGHVSLSELGMMKRGSSSPLTVVGGGASSVVSSSAASSVGAPSSAATAGNNGPSNFNNLIGGGAAAAAGRGAASSPGPDGLPSLKSMAQEALSTQQLQQQHLPDSRSSASAALAPGGPLGMATGEALAPPPLSVSGFLVRLLMWHFYPS